MPLDEFYLISISLSFFGVLMTPLESQKTTPLVSILIINYNTAEVTIKSIENIIANTDYQPYKIIIIDNDSEKDDQHMLVDYAEQKSLIHYLMERIWLE